VRRSLQLVLWMKPKSVVTRNGEAQMKMVIQKKKSKKLPSFNRMSDEEIAQFWDNHSFVDYWDDMKEVQVIAKRLPTEVIGLRLEKKDLEQIKRFSQKLGLGYSTLLRVWIKEKLLQLQAIKTTKKANPTGGKR